MKKWNESGFRPPLCTYRLNWARRTSWGWWDDWDDTVLQTQDSSPGGLRPSTLPLGHGGHPTILTFTRGWGRNNFVSFKPPRPGTEPRTLAWKAAVLTTTLGPPPCIIMGRALPANTKTWPNVVSMLVQRRWRWANSEAALGQILALGQIQPIRVLFCKTAGQSQAYYYTWNWERGTYDVNHLHILTCEVAVSRVGSVLHTVL